MPIAFIIKISLHTLINTLPILLPLAILRVYYLSKRKVDSKSREVLLWIFVFYLCWLYQITVYRYGVNWDTVFHREDLWKSVNLVPFRNLVEILHRNQIGYFLYNVVGNLMWFVPFGLIYPLIAKKGKHFVTVGGSAALVSLSIEILQWVCNTGESELDDVILNTLGALIGYVIYKVGQWFWLRKGTSSKLVE